MHLASAYPSDIAIARAARTQGGAISRLNLAALKALKSRPEVVIVETGQAKGVWQWNAGDSTTADDALVVNPTSGTAGRYKRIFNGAVFPGWYGTEQGSLTNGAAADATAQVLAACQSGYMVDGGNLWWGITGSMRPLSNFVGLRNFKCKQLAPSVAHRTLFIDERPNWIIQNGVIDCGGDQDASNTDDSAGLWISGSATENWKAIDIEVYNGGPINGIFVNGASKGQLVRPVVHDFVYNLSPDPTDDVINGIRLNLCTDVEVISAKVHDLTGFLLSAASLRYTRGIALSGCTRCHVVAPNVSNVDQGVDLTGSAINTECHVSNVTIGETGTWGVKFSNDHRQCSVGGGTISDAGQGGVVVSAAAGLTPIDTQISGLTIKNIGSSGLWSGANPSGVKILVGNSTYPRGVRVRNVDVVDTQGSPTTAYGFYSEAGPIDNYIDHTCRSRNCTNHMSGFSILNPGYVEITARGVDFNDDNSDTPIKIVLPQPYTEYVVNRVAIANASGPLTTATCSMWTEPNGAGTAIVASGSAITVSTGSDNTNNNTQSLTIVNAQTNAWKHTTLYFRVQTAQGSAATGDVTIIVEPRS